MGHFFYRSQWLMDLLHRKLGKLQKCSDRLFTKEYNVHVYLQLFTRIGMVQSTTFCQAVNNIDFPACYCKLWEMHAVAHEIRNNPSHFWSVHRWHYSTLHDFKRSAKFIRGKKIGNDKEMVGCNFGGFPPHPVAISPPHLPLGEVKLWGGEHQNYGEVNQKYAGVHEAYLQICRGAWGIMPIFTSP